MKMTALLWSAVTVLAGCATVISPTSTTVKEATAQQVTSCKLIKSIAATSPFYGVFAGQAMRVTREKILLEAEAVGATHIVFGQSEAGYGSTTQNAQAFDCK